MGNIFQFAVKILTTTAKLIVAALTVAPAPVVQPKPVQVAAKPTQIRMVTVECPTNDRCFETSEGKVFIFRDARSILP
ncbi:MAG: hypothetical protein ACKVQS_11095 [Fimbriimonadaceae bacterium]